MVLEEYRCGAMLVLNPPVLCSLCSLLPEAERRTGHETEAEFLVGAFRVCHDRRDIQGAAENARSREKTGLKAHEGDEDLVDYYYLVMHPNTQHGLDLRRSDGKRFRLEACPKLKERFSQSFQYAQPMESKSPMTEAPSRTLTIAV